MTARERAAVERARRWSIALGLVALAVYAIVTAIDPRRPMLPYLVAYVFWWDVAVGLVGLLLLQRLMRGDWGRSTRPVLEAGGACFPLLALLFLPIVLSMRGIYPWAHAGAGEFVQNDHVRSWFNPAFFVVRAVIYLVLWSVLGRVGARRAPPELDADGLPATRATRVAAAWGMVALALSSTFAAIDWVRSLDPSWRSTTYGLYFLAGQGLSGFGFVIVFAAFLRARVPAFSARFGVKPLRDVAKLMFTFVILWAYIAFTQFLIIWSGNIPEETRWYVARSGQGWHLVVIALITLHFAVPFLLLLPRYTNERLGLLVGIALLLLAMRFVDAYWLIAPAQVSSPWPPPWRAFIAVAGIGCVFIGALLRQLERAAAHIETGLASVAEHGR